jgi:hypothetical protein
LREHKFGSAVCRTARRERHRSSLGGDARSFM